MRIKKQAITLHPEFYSITENPLQTYGFVCTGRIFFHTGTRRNRVHRVVCLLRIRRTILNLISASPFAHERIAGRLRNFRMNEIYVSPNIAAKKYKIRKVVNSQQKNKFLSTTDSINHSGTSNVPI